jgi:hypothetical protein
LVVADFVVPEDFDFLVADVVGLGVFVVADLFVVVVHGFAEVHDFDFLVPLAVVRDFVAADLFAAVVVHGFDFPDLVVDHDFVVVVLFVVVAVHGFDFPVLLVVVLVNHFFYRCLFPDPCDVYRFFLNSLN